MTFKLAGLAIICMIRIGDHLPPSKTALGTPEHMLAEVNVYDDKIDSVLRRLGKPDHFKDETTPDFPIGSGERSYEWDRNGIRLRVETEYYTDKATGAVLESTPYAVDVWGRDRVGPVTRTSHGLSLGDGMQQVVKIYGARFFKNSDHSLLMQWNDETELNIDFNEQKKIVHMQLVASVE